MPNSELKQGVFWPEKVEEFEKQTHPENINCEIVTDDNRKEIKRHNEVVGSFMFSFGYPQRKKKIYEEK